MGRTGIKILLACSLFVLPVFYGNILSGRGLNPDAVVGVWLTKKQDSKIQILKSRDGTFYGRIVWAKEPYEHFTGMEVMRGVTYDARENKYECPWIYSPRLKMSAHAVLFLEGNLLEVKVIKGIISVREEFTRVK